MSDGQHRSGQVDKTLVTGGVVLVLGLIGAAVAFGYAGWKPESIVGMLAGIGSIAGVMFGGLAKLGTLQGKVEQVAHQTNGALKQVVAQETSNQVRAALSDHGLPPRLPARAPGVRRPHP